MRRAVPPTPIVPLALLVGLCSPLHSALAQGWVEIENRRPETPTGPVSRVESRVTIGVEGRLARVRVEERFRNDGGTVAEGSYLYPLAGKASFSDFSLWLNDEELRGEPVAATAENLADAREFVDGLEAEGGTNLAGALDAALESTDDAGRVSQIILLSDGMRRSASRRPIGSPDRRPGAWGACGSSPSESDDVNTYLLDRLAAEGRGAVEYVPPGASVESALGVVRGKLRHPALFDLRIAESPVELRGVQPARLPDLFHGEELVVFGRYREPGAGKLVVTGTRSGRRERVETQADFARSEPGNSFIPRLWAARRIGELTRTIRVEGASPVLVEEIRELGLRFGILTEYTSYLVQEPAVLAGRPAPIPPAEAARNQTGAAAFERAGRSAKFADANTLQAADELTARSLGAAAAAPGAGDAPGRRPAVRAAGVGMDRHSPPR